MRPTPLLLGLLLLFCAGLPASAATKLRYLAVFRDGTTATSDNTPSWHETASGRRFNGRPLFAGGNDVLVLRDRYVTPQLNPPYVQMANGDILPGEVVGYSTSDERFGLRPLLYVAPTGAIEPARGDRLAIRADRVERIVTTSRPLTSAIENTVLLVDGRTQSPRSLRFSPQGITMLTEQGVVNAGFAEIADACFSVDRLQAVVEDNLAAGSSTDAHIARLTTRDGARLSGTKMFTFTERNRERRSRVPETRTRIFLQPAWSLEALTVVDTAVCRSGFRRANELPLSHLAASGIVQRSVLQPATTWQRDVNHQGQPLASGELEADAGLSTHAHSEIAFDLPEQAQTLSLQVGLDRAVGNGGCVVCKLRRDSSQGEELWSSGLLRGQDGPQSVGPIPLQGAKRIVLITELGHAGRPAGADPFDIRDDVVWLSPLVTVAPQQLLTPALIAGFLGLPEGWRIDPTQLPHLRLTNVWNDSTGRWDSVVRIAGNQQFTLRRTLPISVNNDVLEFVTTAPLHSNDQELQLQVGNEPIPYLTSADRERAGKDSQRVALHLMRTSAPRVEIIDDSLRYWWDLQAYRGQEITVTLHLRAEAGGSEYTWRSLALRTAISNLPASGKLPQPDVALTSLTPLASSSNKASGDPQANAIPIRGRPPLTFVGQKYSDGYGLMRNSQVSFAVLPEYRRFVALVGTCQEQLGPFRVLVNDRVVWETPLRAAALGAEWIDLPLPAGAVKLTLETGAEGGYYGSGAFASAGFMTTTN